MKYLLYKNPQNMDLWRGQAIDGIKHPVNIVDLWNEADLNALGLYALERDTSEPPPGQQIRRTVLVKQGNKIVERKIYTPIPSSGGPPAPGE